MYKWEKSANLNEYEVVEEEVNGEEKQTKLHEKYENGHWSKACIAVKKM